MTLAPNSARTWIDVFPRWLQLSRGRLPFRRRVAARDHHDGSMAVMRELVADAAKQQLDNATPASPTNNDQIRVLAVRDVRDDPGRAAVLHDHPVRQTRLA